MGNLQNASCYWDKNNEGRGLRIHPDERSACGGQKCDMGVGLMGEDGGVPKRYFTRRVMPRVPHVAAESVCLFSTGVWCLPIRKTPCRGRTGRDGCVVYNTQLGGSPKEHPRKHALRFPST